MERESASRNESDHNYTLVANENIDKLGNLTSEKLTFCCNGRLLRRTCTRRASRESSDKYGISAKKKCADITTNIMTLPQVAGSGTFGDIPAGEYFGRSPVSVHNY